MKVGFIGVGNMGGPMCRNIVKRSNHQVSVFDLNAAAVKTCTDLGATAAKSIADVTKGADVVMTSLPMPKDVEAVTLGDGGILANIGKGQTYIDLSTNAPSMVKKIGAAMAAKGIAMLDAPVSGGTARAQSGDLSVIVGGERAVFDKCQDLFTAMGSRSFHVGPLGSGLAMKLVNNMLVQVNTVAVAEAMVLGVKAGLDPQMIYDVVRVSTGASAAWEMRVPRILAGDYEPGGTVDISYKDQELETAFAKRLGVPVLLANVTQQVYQMARAQGLNKQDGSAVVKVFERLAGVTVKEGNK